MFIRIACMFFVFFSLKAYPAQDCYFPIILDEDKTSAFVCTPFESLEFEISDASKMASSDIPESILKTSIACNAIKSGDLAALNENSVFPGETITLNSKKSNELLMGLAQKRFENCDTFKIVRSIIFGDFILNLVQIVYKENSAESMYFLAIPILTRENGSHREYRLAFDEILTGVLLLVYESLDYINRTEGYDMTKIPENIDKLVEFKVDQFQGNTYNTKIYLKPLLKANNQELFLNANQCLKSYGEYLRSIIENPAIGSEFHNEDILDFCTNNVENCGNNKLYYKKVIQTFWKGNKFEEFEYIMDFGSVYYGVLMPNGEKRSRMGFVPIVSGNGEFKVKNFLPELSNQYDWLMVLVGDQLKVFIETTIGESRNS